MQPRTKTLALAVGGIVALGGVTLFFRKIGHAPPPPAIRAEAPAANAAAPSDAGPPETKPGAAKTAAVPEVPLSPKCAALRKTNEETIRKFEKRQKLNCLVVPPDVGCVTTPDGITWGYRIARIHVEPVPAPETGHEKLPCDPEHDVELVRQDRTGTKVLANANETLQYDWRTKLNEISLEALTDYDGDGEIEIFRAHNQQATEAEDQHEAAVLTFKDGNLTPYPPAANLSIVVPRDVDGDGRLDLLSSGPYANVRSFNALGNGEDLVSAVFAYHSLSDGTFALDDAAAIDFTRSQCPSPPKAVSLTLEDTTGGSPDLADQLVCARLWGVSRAKIEAAWNAVCKDFDASENPFACKEWPLDLAKVTQPFQLR